MINYGRARSASGLDSVCIKSKWLIASIDFIIFAGAGTPVTDFIWWLLARTLIPSLSRLLHAFQLFRWRKGQANERKKTVRMHKSASRCVRIWLLHNYESGLTLYVWGMHAAHTRYTSMRMKNHRRHDMEIFVLASTGKSKIHSRLNLISIFRKAPIHGFHHHRIMCRSLFNFARDQSSIVAGALGYVHETLSPCFVFNKILDYSCSRCDFNYSTRTFSERTLLCVCVDATNIRLWSA